MAKPRKAVRKQIVWLVTIGDYGWDLSVVGVYSTQQRAETAGLKEKKRVGLGEIAIIECMLDD